jgi:hypothetical protein
MGALFQDRLADWTFGLNINFDLEDYIETALRNDWRQGVQTIYQNLLPIEKWAFKRQQKPYGIMRMNVFAV